MFSCNPGKVLYGIIVVSYCPGGQTIKSSMSLTPHGVSLFPLYLAFVICLIEHEIAFNVFMEP